MLGHCVAGDEHRSAELLQFDNSMFSVGLQRPGRPRHETGGSETSGGVTTLVTRVSPVAPVTRAVFRLCLFSLLFLVAKGRARVGLVGGAGGRFLGKIRRFWVLVEGVVGSWAPDPRASLDADPDLELTSWTTWGLFPTKVKDGPPKGIPLRKGTKQKQGFVILGEKYRFGGDLSCRVQSFATQLA